MPFRQLRQIFFLSYGDGKPMERQRFFGRLVKRSPSRKASGRETRLVLSQLWQQNTNKRDLMDRAFRSKLDTSQARHNFCNGLSYGTNLTSSVSHVTASSPSAYMVAAPLRHLLGCFALTGLGGTRFRLSFRGFANPGRRVSAAPRRSALGYPVIAPSRREDRRTASQ